MLCFSSILGCSSKAGNLFYSSQNISTSSIKSRCDHPGKNGLAHCNCQSVYIIILNDEAAKGRGRNLGEETEPKAWLMTPLRVPAVMTILR